MFIDNVSKLIYCGILEIYNNWKKINYYSKKIYYYSSSTDDIMYNIIKEFSKDRIPNLEKEMTNIRDMKYLNQELNTFKNQDLKYQLAIIYICYMMYNYNIIKKNNTKKNNSK